MYEFSTRFRLPLLESQNTQPHIKDYNYHEWRESYNTKSQCRH